MSKSVCVIGAGASGLVVMKELQAAGHTFECYDMLPQIGGVYLKSYKNTILTTSSLMTAWSDHSDGKEEKPKFWTAEVTCTTFYLLPALSQYQTTFLHCS
jgi:cation diffusion facilitator CzcD-associated flavoprotein CzcO